MKEKLGETIFKLILISFAIAMITMAMVCISFFTPCNVYTTTILPGSFAQTEYLEGEMTDRELRQIPSISNNRILSIPVKEGDYVRKGDVICVYETGKNQEFEYLLSELYTIRKGYTDYAATQMPVLNYEAENKRITEAEEAVRTAGNRLEAAKQQWENAAARGDPQTFYYENEYRKVLGEYEYQEALLKQYRSELAAAQAQDRQTISSTTLALEYLNSQTKELQEVLKNTSEKTTSVLLSPCSGKVKEVYGKAGKRMAVGSPLMTISEPEQGYSLSVEVPNEYVDSVVKAEQLDLKSYYWDYDMIATVDSVSADPEKEASRIITLKIDSDEGCGHRITVPVTRYISFKSVIPNYAIHGDDNELYIYLVKKVSLFGKEYDAAIRQRITVNYQDSLMTAVSDDLTNEILVVSNNKQLRNGKPVRILS